APAKIFRGHTMKRGESRHSESRKNLRRNFVKEPGPAAKCPGLFIIQVAVVSKKLRLRNPHLLHDVGRHLVEHAPNRLLTIVRDALRPGSDFSQKFGRKVASADLIDAPRQHRAPIDQPTLPQKGWRHSNAQRKK